MPRRGMAGVAALMVIAAACGGRPAPRPATDTPAPAASPSAPSTEDRLFEGAVEVHFDAPDGQDVYGRLWEGGDVAVILAHGHDLTIGQGGWHPFSQFLSGEGFTVLTFNFRGFCDLVKCSDALGVDYETYWRDVVGAVEYLSGRGLETIFVVGASMGGIATFRAAAAEGVNVAGIVSLSTPQWPSRYYPQEPPENDVTPARLRAIAEPKLFVAGEEETPFADDARSMHEASDEPKELVLVPSGLHSSQLVTNAPDDVLDRTRTAILRFIAAHAG